MAWAVAGEARLNASAIAQRTWEALPIEAKGCPSLPLFPS